MRNNLRNVNLTALAIGLVLLGALAVEGRLRPQPSEAEPYHAKVREVIRAMPKEFGDWEGNDERITEAAMRLLKPNEIYSRSFRNRVTGHQVSVLIVHCKDARDLYGHYPPVCYPAHGMEERSRTPEDWYVEGQKIPGMEYVFRGQGFGSTLTVNNFILVPGEIGRDMQALDDRIGDYTSRFYGAAQLQVVFRDTGLSPAERDTIFQEMIRYHMPIIDAIRSGDTDER